MPPSFLNPPSSFSKSFNALMVSSTYTIVLSTSFAASVAFLQISHLVNCFGWVRGFALGWKANYLHEEVDDFVSLFFKTFYIFVNASYPLFHLCGISKYCYIRSRGYRCLRPHPATSAVSLLRGLNSLYGFLLCQHCVRSFCELISV